MKKYRIIERNYVDDRKVKTDFIVKKLAWWLWGWRTVGKRQWDRDGSSYFSKYVFPTSEAALDYILTERRDARELADAEAKVKGREHVVWAEL